MATGKYLDKEADVQKEAAQTSKQGRKTFFSFLLYEGLEISSVAMMQCKSHLQTFFFAI